MEIRVAQASFCNAVHGRGWYDAAERARRTETLVIRHDEQDVGRALGRHDARCPPGLRVRSLFVDHTAEFRRRLRNLFSVDGCCCAGRAGSTGGLLSEY